MFQLVVGEDVKLSFDSADLSRAGLSLSDVFSKLLARQGLGVGRALEVSCGEDGGVVGELGGAGACVGRCAGMVLEESKEGGLLSGGSSGPLAGRSASDGGGGADTVVVGDRGCDESVSSARESRLLCGVFQRQCEETVCGSGHGSSGGDISGVGAVGADAVSSGGGGARGANYERNRANRLRQKGQKKRRKMAEESWRPVSQATVRPFESSPPPSLTGTVKTVTTELAEELEARRTLASRRAAENKVAEALASHKLQSMLDPDKTKAVASLDAARVEQRINEAKAKAQAAYLKCSDAVTSLGSAGSAGEYVLKKEVKKGQIYQKKYEDAYAQMQEMMQYLSNEAKAKMAEWPAVKIPTYGEMFGDCPVHYNDDEAEAYYRDLERLDNEHVHGYPSDY